MGRISEAKLRIYFQFLHEVPDHMQMAIHDCVYQWVPHFSALSLPEEIDLHILNSPDLHDALDVQLRACCFQFVEVPRNGIRDEVGLAELHEFEVISQNNSLGYLCHEFACVRSKISSSPFI